VALACGSDGLTRLVWANPLGIASLWIMDAQNVYQSFTIFGPYTGWIPTDMDVGSDNLARLLWTSTVDGRAIVWSVDSSGNPSDNTNFYGPYAGYAAQRVACGSDGYTRLTWLRGDGVLSFSHMSADNTMLTFNIYGPYF
jgi:WD40 repeat protein